MNTKDQNHIVVVEPYEGYIEFLSDEPVERIHAQGLGLPLEEIAERLNCRVTILCWEEWYRYEVKQTWVPTPSTRPVSQPNFVNSPAFSKSERVKRVPILPIDPEYKLHFDERGLSPRSHGLINDSGLLSFASYCLNKELQQLFSQDTCQAVIMPMWGGIGYISQMARATLVPNFVDVPFVVVVTDISVNRQRANEEGIWSKQAIVQRQMEDVSLALADLVLVFGTRAHEIALAGRLPEAPTPVYSPRFVEDKHIDQIAEASVKPFNINKSLQLFLYEPQQAASGVLVTVDAVNLLTNKGIRLDRPLISAGPAMTFAPMKPIEFVDYWSSRGFVQELTRERQWGWRREYPQLDEVFPIRLYPSLFDHLPYVWAELATGSLVLLSQAAAEGLAPGEALPNEVLIQGEPTPGNLADCLERIIGTDVKRLDEVRRELCRRVAAAHRGEHRERTLKETVEALKAIIQSPPKPQDMSRVSLLFLDRRIPLRAVAQDDKAPAYPEPRAGTKKKTLSVVVTCYEMGPMIKEAVESVWASERITDEVLLINDGSQKEETLHNIRELEKKAYAKGLPLKVIHQRNRGLAKARNAGLDAANGEFVSFLDGDDLIEPEFYGMALRILENYPRLGGVAAWASIFGENVADGFWNAPQTELPFLFIENSVIVPCLTRTELLRNLGGYDARQRYNYEDWELSIRMLGSGLPIITIPMHLTRYRVRKESLYRSMTYVQNQVMRELLLANHRELVSKFSVEIAMQLENQWMKYVYPDGNSTIKNDTRNFYSQPEAGAVLSEETIKKYRSLLFKKIRKIWWATRQILTS